MPDVSDFVWFLSFCWELFGTEFTLYGFVLSWRQVFGYGFVLTFVIWGIVVYLDL